MNSVAIFTGLLVYHLIQSLCPVHFPPCHQGFGTELSSHIMLLLKTPAGLSEEVQDGPQGLQHWAGSLVVWQLHHQ